MDQIRIGKFIAESRRSKGLTQRQLADALAISDKTVSKWETGRGLPEVSLMLPLCGALGITVNDLLSGERISAADYQKRAEGNMMNLIRENEENRRRMALSVVIGAITVVAVCALVTIAALVELPAAARVTVIVFTLAVGAAGIAAAAVLDSSAGYFECPYCRELFVPGMKEYVKSYHTLTKRRLTCPKCGKTGMCRHRITR